MDFYGMTRIDVERLSTKEIENFMKALGVERQRRIDVMKTVKSRDDHFRALVSNAGKIVAISEFRRFTGVELAVANEYIRSLLDWKE